MWRRLKNFFASISTYADLSPSLQTRYRVRQVLHQRPALTADEWFETHWRSLNVSYPVVAFVLEQMSRQTGLDFSRVLPGDRLYEDLQLSLICWFDWEITFSKEFDRCFNVNLGEQFNSDNFNTVQDLVVFLELQLSPINCS
jgi:hypothetical protein